MPNLKDVLRRADVVARAIAQTEQLDATRRRQ
jgi:hypothetical protein